MIYLSATRYCYISFVGYLWDVYIVFSIIHVIYVSKLINSSYFTFMCEVMDKGYYIKKLINSKVKNKKVNKFRLSLICFNSFNDNRRYRYWKSGMLTVDCNC
jgi:hypothetical protein